MTLWRAFRGEETFVTELSLTDLNQEILPTSLNPATGVDDQKTLLPPLLLHEVLPFFKQRQGDVLIAHWQCRRIGGSLLPFFQFKGILTK